ncbi:MAG: FHA domain-containing protein [Myxococcales bacterium]|jgi:hypothetical protein
METVSTRPPPPPSAPPGPRPAVFVEVLGRFGQVLDRTRIERFPATVGRAYSNDVILDDPHVYPEHARVDLQPDGSLYVVQQGERTPVSLQEGLSLQLGRTTVRFRTPEFRLEPTRQRPLEGGWLGRIFASPPRQLATLAVIMVVLTAKLYLESTRDFVTSESRTLVGLVVFLTLWSGLWAFFNRLVSHRFQLLSHVTVAALVVVAFNLFDIVSEYGSFLVNVDDAATSAVFMAFGVGLFFFGHLSVIGVRQLRTRLWAALGASAAIVALLVLGELDAVGEYSGRLAFPSALKPLAPELVPTVSADDFFAASDELKASVDREAAE